VEKTRPHWLKSALVNGLGGLVTGITVLVVLVAKFAEGAWITVIFIPLLIFLFRVVRRHYHMVRVATSCAAPVVPVNKGAPPIAVVPIEALEPSFQAGARNCSRLSPEIIAIHVEPGEHSELLQTEWERFVEQPSAPPAPSRPSSPLCHLPTASSSFPSFNTFSALEKHPIGILLS